jgi:outer membrane lipoprotein-sorting protein
MKNIIFALVALLSFSLSSIAQNENPKDPKAKTILDKVSAANKAASTIYIEFNYRLVNKPNGIDETQKGTVWIKGEQYKLIFPGIERYSDGKAVWTFLEDDDECQISSATGDDEEGSFSPSSMLTIYENGFNYVYGSEVMIDGKKADMIKLFPEGGGKPYHSIKIYIDKASSQISKIEVFGKDGNTFTYDLKVIKTDQPMDNKMFVFDISKAGDLVDLRD